MGKAIKILIVEDEMLIGAKISLQLSNLGYVVTGIVPRGGEALQHIANERPDIVLLDIQLKGKLNGIETAHLIKKDFEIPIIYLTANADDDHFQKAKATLPEAFISKPYKKLDLQHAIELVVNKLEIQGFTKNHDSNFEQPEILDDRIFIRQRDELVKLFLSDILFVEADRNYCILHTANKHYTIVMTLKEINAKLKGSNFIRIHRSYLVNLTHIDTIGNNHVTILRLVLPVSKSYRENLLKKLQKF